MKLRADWVTAPHSRVVMEALDGQGFFVGGCVRNALLEAPVSDIDVATPLPPDEVLARLEKSGIKAIPTGLQHGTVTAVHQATPVEITTFRRDVETDGRHAKVTYTEEIAQDAGRRDFTMNALYADQDGALVDPLGGLPDLRARRVRFIGEARDRIREDYLRILRFFRFHAWYGADGIDPEGLAACAELADGIDQLARERIGWEIRKLLGAPDPAPSLASMEVSGILARCLPGATASAVPVLVHLEDQLGTEPEWKRRLVALGGEELQSALRLSRAEERDLKTLVTAVGTTESDKITAYRHGAGIAWSAALIRAASTGADVPVNMRADLEAAASVRFPIKPKDLMTRGIEAGPKLGEMLRLLEDHWIASGFELEKQALLEEIVDRS
ncbi:MAG: CCA tRNA nucleotidyltransferase [Pseudomonadota bacterium]